jgi:hypothetical protein
MDTEKKRRRIARIAGRNGWTVAVVAALCLVVSLLELSAAGILVCLAGVASGCMELSGRRRLKENSLEAGRWLARSQLLLMAAIILYSAYHLLAFDPKKFMTDIPPDLRSALLMYGDQKAIEGWLTKAVHILYRSLMAGTLLYQGGLGLYYTWATRKLDRAAAESQGKL